MIAFSLFLITDNVQGKQIVCFGDLSLLSAAQEESSAARLNNGMECTLIFMFCLLSLRQK